MENDRLNDSFSIEECALQNVIHTWQHLLAEYNLDDDIYKTPWYFEFLQRRQDNPRLNLLKLTSACGRPLIFVPLLWDNRELRFDISLHNLGAFTIKAVVVLGRQLILPKDTNSHDALFKDLFHIIADVNAIWFNALSTNSFLFNYFKSSIELRRLFYVYIPFGPRRCHIIPLPESFADYKAKLTRKKRYNLNRQFQQLKEHLKVDVRLQRLDDFTEFSTLIEAINALIPEKIRPDSLLLDELAEFARRGYLLCYALRSDNKYIALVLGFQYAGTYHIFSTEYDDDLKQFSPGTTLQHLLIEDVINKKIARQIDLGFGEGKYRHTSTNYVEERATVILCKKTLRNFIYINVHRYFYAIIDSMEPLKNFNYTVHLNTIKQLFNGSQFWIR